MVTIGSWRIRSTMRPATSSVTHLAGARRLTVNSGAPSGRRASPSGPRLRASPF